jgi:hypothetical protein
MSQQTPDYRQHFIDQFNALASAFEEKLADNDTRGCKEIVETEVLLQAWIDALPEPEVKYGTPPDGLEDDDPGELEPDTPDDDRSGRFFAK